MYVRTYKYEGNSLMTWRGTLPLHSYYIHIRMYVYKYEHKILLKFTFVLNFY